MAPRRKPLPKDFAGIDLGDELYEEHIGPWVDGGFDDLADYEHIYYRVEEFSHGWETSRPNKPIELFSAREVGIEGERLACTYLEERGYDILTMNWVTPFGEADIVARDSDDVTVLVEVKSRLELGPEARRIMPELAVDGKKLDRYRAIALFYLAMYAEVQNLRFDVLALNIIADRTAKVRHLKGAFAWDEQ